MKKLTIVVNCLAFPHELAELEELGKKIINENHPLCAAIKLSSSNSLPFGSLDPNMAFEVKEIQ